MARILFTWELGEGSGHLAPYVNLISRLQDKGHEIGFMSRSLQQAQTFFHGSGVRLYQSPVVHPGQVEMIRPINTHAKILHNSGYDKVSRLSGTIQAWRNFFELYKPHLIVFDYSPTAMLASRGLEAGRIVIGTGFHLPPDIKPFPRIPVPIHNIKKSNAESRELHLGIEKKVLDVTNESLKTVGIESVDSLHDIFSADRTIFRTFAELDHYGERESSNYVGILRSDGGAPPDWPSEKGPKIFAYVKLFKTLPAFLEILGKKKYPTLIYGSNLPAKIKNRFSSETMRFVEKPLDMNIVGSEADAVICHAGHSTTAEMLLSGVPMLMLPLYSEQIMVALNVERLGAGLAAPMMRPKPMMQKLDKLLHEKSFKEAAIKFSKQHGQQSDGQSVELILREIESQLGTV